MKQFIKLLILIFLIIILCLSDGEGAIIISVPLMICCFLLLLTLLKQPKLILKKSNNYLKEFKYLFLFLFFSIIGFLFNLLHGNLSFGRFLLSFFVTYICSFIAYYLLGVILPFIFSKKRILQIFVITLLAIIFFGFIEFIIFDLHIYSFASVLFFITGKTTLLSYKIGSVPRIQSFFQEPSLYAWYLSCVIPFTFGLFYSKYKIFQNKLANKFIKKGLLPLVLLSLILTQSPINLVFGIVFCIACYALFNNISLKRILNYSLTFGFVFTLSLIILKNVDISETFINRILITIESFGDFNKFMVVEESLATRIVSYVNMFIIWLHNPVFGTGCGSLSLSLYKQLPNSPLPLPYELYMFNIMPFNGGANPAIFFKLIVDTGLVGLICISAFLFNINKKINFLLESDRMYPKEIMKGIKYSFIVFIFLMFYNSSFSAHFYWCLFGVISGLYLQTQLIREIKRKNTYIKESKNA